MHVLIIALHVIGFIAVWAIAITVLVALINAESKSPGARNRHPQHYCRRCGHWHSLRPGPNCSPG